MFDNDTLQKQVIRTVDLGCLKRIAVSPRADPDALAASLREDFSDGVKPMLLHLETTSTN